VGEKMTKLPRAILRQMVLVQYEDLTFETFFTNITRRREAELLLRQASKDVARRCYKGVGFQASKIESANSAQSAAQPKVTAQPKAA
jgi:hypothetical protein